MSTKLQKGFVSFPDEVNLSGLIFVDNKSGDEECNLELEELLDAQLGASFMQLPESEDENSIKCFQKLRTREQKLYTKSDRHLYLGKVQLCEVKDSLLDSEPPFEVERSNLDTSSGNYFFGNISQDLSSQPLMPITEKILSKENTVNLTLQESEKFEASNITDCFEKSSSKENSLSSNFSVNMISENLGAQSLDLSSLSEHLETPFDQPFNLTDINRKEPSKQFIHNTISCLQNSTKNITIWSKDEPVGSTQTTAFIKEDEVLVETVYENNFGLTTNSITSPVISNVVQVTSPRSEKDLNFEASKNDYGDECECSKATAISCEQENEVLTKILQQLKKDLVESGELYSKDCTESYSRLRDVYRDLSRQISNLADGSYKDRIRLKEQLLAREKYIAELEQDHFESSGSSALEQRIKESNLVIERLETQLSLKNESLRSNQTELHALKEENLRLKTEVVRHSEERYLNEQQCEQNDNLKKQLESVLSELSECRDQVLSLQKEKTCLREKVSEWESRVERESCTLQLYQEKNLADFQKIEIAVKDLLTTFDCASGDLVAGVCPRIWSNERNDINIEALKTYIHKAKERLQTRESALMEQFLAKEKELEDVMNNFQDLKNDVGLKDALLDALKKENAELLYTNKSLNDFIEHLEAVKEEALMLLKSFINEAQTSPLLERRTESEFTWKNILEELKKKKDEILAGIRSREAELTRVTTCLEELKMRYDSLREKKDHEITSLKETLESECTQREKLATEKAQVEKVNEESLAQLESLTLLNKKLLSEKAQLQHLLEEKNKILQEKERTNTLEGLRPEKEDVCFLVECWPDSFKKFLRVLLEESSRYFLEKRSGSLMESTNYFEKTAAEFDHFEETTKKELYAFIEKVVNFKKKEAGNLDIGQKEVGANKENSGEYLASSRLLDDSLHREISRCKESLRKMNDVLQLKEKDIFKLNNLVNILKEEQRHYAQGWIEHVVKETCEAMFASGHQPTFNNCEDSTWASEAGFTFLRKTDLDFIQKRKEAYICYVSEKIERFQRSEKRCFQQQYEQLLLLMKSKVLEHNRQQQELFQAQFKAEKRILAQKINAYYQGQLENCTCRQRSLRPYPLFTA